MIKKYKIMIPRLPVYANRLGLHNGKQLFFAVLVLFIGLTANAQRKPRWGSNYQLTTKLLTINMTHDPTLPDSLNLSQNPLITELPGLSFRNYKNKNAFRFDLNYSRNYTNSKEYTDSSYNSEANHSNLDFQFGFEHKFLPGRVYPYFFSMLSAGFHNAVGNTFKAGNPQVYDFDIFDLNVGLNAGHGFYFFIIKQLSLNAEMNVLFLNTWNNYTVSRGQLEESSTKYYFTVRVGATFGLNYYFTQK
jgi:hypothetical protein